MKKYLKLVLIGVCMAAMVMLAAGCSAPAAEGSDDFTSMEFEGGELLYAEGDMLVMLDGNATTGYEWTSSIEGTTVKQDIDEYIAEGDVVNGAGEDVVAGAGGVHTFGYRAEGSGDFTITMKYARSWEESPDDKTIAIKGTVENGMFSNVTVE